MALIEKLKKHDDMTECEKDICKYILKHPDKICEMSVCVCRFPKE